MPSLKCSGFACSVRYCSQTAGWWPPELVCLQKVWPQTMSLARQQTLSLLMLCLGWAAEGQHWAWLVPARLSGSKYSFSTTVSTLFCWSHDIRQFSLVYCMAFTWSEMALSMKTTCSIEHEPFKTVPPPVPNSAHDTERHSTDTRGKRWIPSSCKPFYLQWWPACMIPWRNSVTKVVGVTITILFDMEPMHNTAHVAKTWH